MSNENKREDNLSENKEDELNENKEKNVFDIDIGEPTREKNELNDKILSDINTIKNDVNNLNNDIDNLSYGKKYNNSKLEKSSINLVIFLIVITLVIVILLLWYFIKTYYYTDKKCYRTNYYDNDYDNNEQ